MTDDLIQPSPTNPATPIEEAELIRSRQRSRAVVMAVLLGLFVVLVFAISIVKIQLGHAG
ncbi:hypothetical protein [Sphingomonas kyeonggiensis]|uniref:Uncharacterized protein n=1 Tax=Sphingomonas kyeonggiensis TaxID=1268553 RepID=A0A7W6NZQ1_9SPHN|nr:hypothetical protein [Sphingomonas kyeonggiensis]MBB4101031.1 hypothetical protein [Sphingomonas kyeonggiensis]